jgi:hypothetical protein
MQPNEWTRLVARINANYPGHQVDALTAAEWFGPLSQFPAGEVWDAIDRHRRDLTPGRDGLPTGHWAPSLAGILACIDANWRDQAVIRRELEAREARAARNARGGVPMPPETKQALEALRASKSLPGTPGHVKPELARRRIDELADQLVDRVDREQMGQLT